MKRDKSPGEDGITAEFYQEYWFLIQDELRQILKETFLDKTLSESQRLGMISLLYKRGEREDFKNWRPITLLNIDYKICSKVLAERLKIVLPSNIETDQKGFVKGRNIFDSNRMLQYIFDFIDMIDEEGSILFLDQVKAFDYAKWEWLDAIWGTFSGMG